jgi:hypothetical protein
MADTTAKDSGSQSCTILEFRRVSGWGAHGESRWEHVETITSEFSTSTLGPSSPNQRKSKGGWKLLRVSTRSVSPTLTTFSSTHLPTLLPDLASGIHPRVDSSSCCPYPHPLVSPSPGLAHSSYSSCLVLYSRGIQSPALRAVWLRIPHYRPSSSTTSTTSAMRKRPSRATLAMRKGNAH